MTFYIKSTTSQDRKLQEIISPICVLRQVEAKGQGTGKVVSEQEQHTAPL